MKGLALKGFTIVSVISRNEEIRREFVEDLDLMVARIELSIYRQLASVPI